MWDVSQFLNFDSTFSKVSLVKKTFFVRETPKTFVNFDKNFFLTQKRTPTQIHSGSFTLFQSNHAFSKYFWLHICY